MLRHESMLGHLIMQFKGKPVFSAFLASVGEEMDEVQAAFDDLKNKRWIDTGEGVQLDGIGKIVGQNRIIENAIPIPFFGFNGQPGIKGFEMARFRTQGEAWLSSVRLSDPEYRTVLWAKVAKNISQSRTEETIDSLKFVFAFSLDGQRTMPKVFIHDAGNAKFIVGIGRRLEPNEMVLASALDLVVRAGGVGIRYTTHFDYDNYFGFQGQPNAKTFGIGSFADIL